MKDAIIIGLAAIGLVTLGIDYFILEALVTSDLEEARKWLWILAGMAYLFLLIHPYMMLDDNRRETVADVATAGGIAIMSVARYLALGFLLYTGWHLASNVFNAI